MSKITITVKKKFLVLPIGNNAAESTLLFYCKGRAVKNIDLRLDYINPMQNMFCDISEFMGEEIELESLQGVEVKDIQTDVKAAADFCEYRPLVHFTPQVGWINDPNGMLEYTSPISGEKSYHMFFQYNPYDTNWGNMHWGHAISKDLMHWLEKEIALYPDEMGTMFSGSAIVDKQNLTGFKNGSEDVILLYYTAAGNTDIISKDKEFVQCLAFSVDGGKTFKKYNDNPVVSCIEMGNRDPKVVWCDELDKYIMALYLDGNDYGILTSENLIKWELLQKISITDESECPDIYPLNVDGDPKKRVWVLSGASHKYVVCKVINGKFEVIQQTKSLNFGNHSYASQSFSGITDGRCISIAWNKSLTFPDACFNGQMSIPMELTLVKVNSEYLLCSEFVKEINGIFKEKSEFKNLTLTTEKPFKFQTKRSTYLLKLQLEGAEKAQLEISIFGNTVKIDTAKNTAEVDDINMPLIFGHGEKSISMFIDICSIQLSCGGAIATAPFICDYNNSQAVITASENTVIKSFEACRVEL